MNERKINVLAVGEYKKNLENVTHYIDDCINRINGSLKTLINENIIEGKIANTLENASEELSKIRTEVNEELDSFTTWIDKNIEGTTLLDERHARELEEELNTMEFFKDAYIISGGNTFLTGNNNMKFDSSSGKPKDNNSKDGDKKSAEKDKNSSNNKATDSNATKLDNTDKTLLAKENSNSSNSTEVNGKYIVREYKNKNYRNVNNTDFGTHVYGASKDKFTLQEYKDWNNKDSGQNLPLITNKDTSVPSSPKDYAKNNLDPIYDSNGLNDINRIPDDKLAYQFVETYEIDGQKKSFSYLSEKVPTAGEHYNKVVSFLEQNSNSNSQISRIHNESGMNIVEKVD